MKNLAVFITVTILAFFASDRAFAQHFIQVDDGAGHFTLLKGQTIDPLDVFTFPVGGGILLTAAPVGVHSPVWQTAGNTGAGVTPSTPSDVFGTINNFDVVMEANGTELMRLVSGGGVKMTANLSAIRNVPYSWPASNSAGLLNNDGAGNLTWTSTPVLGLTNAHIFVGNISNVATDVPMAGDVTITNAGVTAIGSNKVLDGMIRQGGATSVIGRSANSTGNVADISAASDGQVLRRAGGVLGFGTVATSGIAPGTNDNFLVTTGGVATWQNFNVGAGLVGNGVSTALKLNVQHDATLTGDGDGVNLGINLGNANIWTNTQSFPTTAAQSTAIVNSINGGSATKINPADLTPLGASGASHSAGIAPDPGAVAGTTKFLREDATWSTIGSSSLTPGVNGNVLVTTGGAATWQNLSIGTGLTGNGVTTTLDANIQHDASLAGAGTTASNLILAIQHDASLTGGGSVASNLTLNLGNANIWTNTQSFPTTAAQSTAIVNSINGGSATKINPADLTALGASGASHSAGIAPDPGAVAGTTKFLREDATWSTIGSSSLTPGTNDNILVTTGGVATWQNLNVGAGLVGNGVSTALKLNVQHDATLTGDGDGVNLGINLGNANIWTNTQSFPTTAAQSTAIVNSINGGSATKINPADLTALGASGASHSAGIAPDPGAVAGTTKFLREDATWSTVGISSLSGGSNDNFLVWTGGVATWQNINNPAGSGISGNGVSTALVLNIQHDASLTGAGTTASNLVLAVQHDASLTGGGSVASNLTINTANANTWTGSQTFGGTAYSPTDQAIADPGPISNQAISAANSYFRVSAANPTSLDGIISGGAPAAGRIITLSNVGTSPITIVDQSSSASGANNRFDLPGSANIILGSKGTITFIYDGTLLRWEVVSTN